MGAWLEIKVWRRRCVLCGGVDVGADVGMWGLSEGVKMEVWDLDVGVEL